MAPLIRVNELSIGFRGPPLLDNVTCQIDAGQRIGLLGRNGSGKTTLMRILTGHVSPDHGQCVVSPGIKVALLPQEVPQNLEGQISEVVLSGLPPLESDESHLWQVQQRVDRLTSQMGLDRDLQVNTLSSGMKRRVLLARSIVSEPDVLLLDEPTNHLDIDTIGWLEDFLLRWPATLIFVTHDRAFLRALATRILEIDRGRLFDWSCDYDTFLERKEAILAAEEKQNALFDKKLSQEEAWLRQGIKARRTRNEGRVRALKKLRLERSKRREIPGAARIEIQQAQRSGALVAKAEGIAFGYAGKSIVGDFSTTVMRGDKIGVIGPNGAGKTTLLKLLLGQLAPQAGTVRLGTNLQIAYFDQLRQQLNEEATVQENLGGGETISINGNPRHVLGYLQDFLFSPERARTPVRYLSGGERNRLLLARLFSKPANVIVLDEPTNDLDTETLELLEERLVAFDGTLLVVSHDRAFLNNVVTSTIVFDAGNVREFVGGYDDWLRQRTEPADLEKDRKPDRAKVNPPPQSIEPAPRDRRLSYQEKRELESLPAEIEALDAEIAKLHVIMARPEYYKQPSSDIAGNQSRLTELEQKLAAAFRRWEELEQLAK